MHGKLQKLSLVWRQHTDFYFVDADETSMKNQQYVAPSLLPECRPASSELQAPLVRDSCRMTRAISNSVFRGLAIGSREKFIGERILRKPIIVFIGSNRLIKFFGNFESVLTIYPLSYMSSHF